MDGTGFWDTAYRDNASALLGVLRRYVKETSVAQDLLHEVFITAIDKYDSYTGKGCFEGWLHRIAVNTALMYLRNEKNKQVPTEAVLSVAGDDDIDDGQADGARAAIEAAEFSGEELLSAIDRLPEHHKLVFNMYVMDDFSHKQIGSELNISPGTSKSHLARARKKIQQFLYDDALSKKKTKDKRWASAFILLFPAKRHFIDKLYREGLSDFSIPPTGGVEILPAALEQHVASVASTASQAAVSTVSVASQAAATAVQSAASITTQAVSTTVFWGSKLSYVAMCCGTAAVTGSVCWVSMSDDSPLNAHKDTVVPVVDTTMYASKPAVPDSTYDATNDFASIPAIPGESVQDSQSDDHISHADNHINPLQKNDETSGPSDVHSLREKENEPPSMTSGKGSPQATANMSSTGNGTNIQQGKGGARVGNKTDSTLHVTRETNQTGSDPASKTEPVVIKKQIIQHQTVVVRDTIIIKE